MRPLLRFTRLPEAALSVVRRVLDEDDELRRRVLSHLDEAGVRERLDEPSLLFLERPDGWSESLAALAAAGEEEAAAAAGARAEGAAARRLTVVQAALDRAEVALEAARREAEALRAEVGEERRARLAAGSDLGRLRKKVRELEAPPPGAPRGHAAGAEEEVASLRAALAAAEERAAQAEAVADELRASPPPAAAPDDPTSGSVAAAPPPLDQVGAVAAVAAAVEAVGALAEALARAAAALGAGSSAQEGWPPTAPVVRGEPERARGPRRAGPVRRPAPLPPAVFDDTAAAAEHLLRLPGVRVLVDGYNVTITSRGGLPLEAQRRWLLDAAAGAAARTGATFDVVFDGAEAGRPAVGGRALGVQVRFTAPDEEADDVVLDLACRIPARHPVVVVSDDRRVREGAQRLGANVLGVAQLVDVLRG